ncbi:MAG: DUF2273 domain-containing protein [bacterium]|nr:DUF2273 domain-containing protein [bacterium]
MNNIFNKIVVSYFGRIVGTIAGIIIALLFIHYGFLRALFIISLATGGFFLGQRLDGDEDMHTILERILPSSE